MFSDIPLTLSLFIPLFIFTPVLLPKSKKSREQDLFLSLTL